MKFDAVNRSNTTQIAIQIVSTDMRNVVLGFKIFLASFLRDILSNGFVDRTNDAADDEFDRIKFDNQVVLPSDHRILFYFYI